MSFRQFCGAAILVLVFGGFFVALTITAGWRVAVGIYAGTTGLMALLFLAADLLTE